MKTEIEVKFLGVVYDQKLTWKPNITKVVERTKKAFNLMRSLSGQTWGASKKALLTLYKALIRSKLDYGSEAYYTAGKSQLERLDVIQAKCLRLSCCAFRSTANNAIQQDCGEMPLWIRRRKLLLRFAVKIAANPRNPANALTLNDWQTEWGQYQAGKVPLNKILREYRTSNEGLPIVPTRLMTPPWHLKPVNTDTALTNLIDKKTSTTLSMKQDALHHIERYKDSNKIYTDASKSTEGTSRVAAAFYIEDLDWGHAARLNDSASIYAAELHAIHMAINWLLQHGKDTKTTILSDSLGAIQSLKDKSSSSQPTAMNALLLSIDKLEHSFGCRATSAYEAMNKQTS